MGRCRSLMVGSLWSSCALAQAAQPETHAEEWVLKQIRLGKVANLRHFSADTEARVLDTTFIEDLLSGTMVDLQLPRPHIHVQYAVFREPLDLTAVEVTREVRLTECIFEAGVDFSGSTFYRDLYLDRTHFKERVRFEGVHAHRNLSIERAQFEGAASFTHLKVALDLNADRVAFVTDGAEGAPAESVSFDFARVGGTFYLREATFGRRLTAICAVVEQSLVGADDYSKARVDFQAGVDFQSFSVQQVFLGSAKFGGAVNFRKATIEGDLVLDDAEFGHGGEECARFDEASVAGSLLMRGAKFAGRADFRSVDVRRDFNAADCVFKSKFIPANFNSMRVGRAAYFDDATFDGQVDFGYANIGSSLSGTISAAGAKFRSATDATSFAELNVLGPANFAGAEFRTTVSFGSAVIIGDFVLDQATLGGDVLCDEMEVRGVTSIDQVVCTSGNTVSIADGECAELTISLDRTAPDNSENRNGLRDKTDRLVGQVEDGTERGSASRTGLSTLDLARARITRSLHVKDLTCDVLEAESLRVGGRALFEDLTIRQTAELRHATLGALQLNAVTWPDCRACIRLDGMQYKYIGSNGGIARWQDLENLLGRSAFNSGVYAQLEKFYEDQGHGAEADDVYVAWKKREGKVLQGPERWWNWLLGLLVRHGRSPHRAFLWSAGIIASGWAVFRRSRMDPRNASDKHERYSSFWYSCDIFIPFVDLSAAQVWIPKREFVVGRALMRIYTLLGWILIPIGVAALTGIIH